MVPGRIVKLGQKSPATDGSLNGFNTITWNDDFILASAYQDSYTGGTTTRANIPNQYCDVQTYALTTATTNYSFKTRNGFVGTSKCTYFITVPAAIGAPAISLIRAEFTNFQMQWAEWDVSAMPSGGFLPNTSTSPSFLGTYVGNFPNPIQKLSNPNIVFNSYTFQHFGDPEANAPGDIGLVGFYQVQPGPF